MSRRAAKPAEHGDSVLEAVLFDMDGLLVDSEPQWFAAERATVAQLGGEWGKQQQLDLLGSNLEFAADYMIRYTASARSRAEVMRLLSDHMTRELQRSVSFRPGAVQLLTSLANTDVAVGLVTSSTREHVEVVLQHLPGDIFHTSVTADDVEYLKPHPMPYLTALGHLEVDPRLTVVLEDSPPGVAAGEAAGCHVVAVPSVAEIPPGPNRTVIESLEQVDIGTLHSVVTARSTSSFPAR